MSVLVNKSLPVMCLGLTEFQNTRPSKQVNALANRMAREVAPRNGAAEKIVKAVRG